MENIKVNDRLIKITLEDGTETEGQILFTFEANGDDFVMYTIGEEAFGAKIDEEDNLSEIPEDEWPLVEKIFEEYMEEQEEYMEEQEE